MRDPQTMVALCLVACAGAPLPDDLHRAQRLEAERRDEEALAAYAAARARCSHAGARAHDDCALAALREAQLLERLGRTREAIEAFVRVRELTLDGRRAARALLRAALLRSDLGERDGALALCRLIVRRWPDEVAAEDALRLLVQLVPDDPNLPAELDQLARELNPHAVSGFALLYRAERAERDGQLELAVATYDELWRRFPRGPLRDDAAWRAARLLRRMGRPSEAAVRLQRLQDTFVPAMFVGHYNKLLLDDAALLLGEIYLEDLGQPARAIAALEGLLRRQPTSLLADDALLLMARAALRQGGADAYARACAYLRRLRRDYPDGNRVRQAQQEEQRLGCP
ncbi:MAG: tetratricopeptide repeat protein [Myxococcales bacterium]|nr:tetratricopeptide repeat protein [Myxococcota bacterium]MDW8282864.1 tetratricopeptide repeat protein [Myxococcales bacterium]